MSAVQAIDPKMQQVRKKALCRAYSAEPQFGLVLGAGVTAASNVPTYEELTLRILENAASLPDFNGARNWAHSFVKEQRSQLRDGRGMDISPAELALVVRSQVGGDREHLRALVRNALYRDAPVRRSVHKGSFESNTTLDAVITFCAARSGTVIASDSSVDIAANRKVGAILTTNYDNLVEGSFHTKYRKKMLKPVGRPTSREWLARDKHRYVIPVFHIHGYVGYRDTDPEAETPKGPDIVIAQDDYFRAFYDPLGFGNYVSMNFLRRYPCLFIGCAMTDQNLRRYLFHLTQNNSNGANSQRRFAILKRSGTTQDRITDSVLLTYGVEAIWVRDFAEISSILKAMYISLKGIAEQDWDYVQGFRWS